MSVKLVGKVKEVALSPEPHNSACPRLCPVLGRVGPPEAKRVDVIRSSIRGRCQTG